MRDVEFKNASFADGKNNTYTSALKQNKESFIFGGF